MGRVMIKTVYLKSILIGLFGTLGLVLVCGSLYYVNLKTIHQVTLQQQAFNWILAGRIIAVDPGHGGYDPGAKGPSGTLEKDVNLVIALRLKEVLEQAGAIVVMTRDQDVDLLSPGEGTMKFRDLSNRLKIVQESKAEVFISIHLNSSGSRWRGAQTFFHPQHDQNKELALAIQEELRHQLQNTQRQALSLTSPYLLKELDIPAVIVEAGFITNPEEERILNDPNYQKQLVRAITAGIFNFLSKR